MDLKKMSWNFAENGKLICEQGEYTFIITEHMTDELHMCGYDVKAFVKGSIEPIYVDFLTSFSEAYESFDIFLFLAERNGPKFSMAL